MRVSTRTDPVDIRSKRKIPRHPLPDEMKCVGGKPHILPSSGNEVLSTGRPEVHGSRFVDRTDIIVTLK